MATNNRKNYRNADPYQNFQNGKNPPPEYSEDDSWSVLGTESP